MMTAIRLGAFGNPAPRELRDTSSLLHECWAGIELPCVNALLVISIATVVSLTYGW
jgi:hypothetical protein